jgi:CHASE3 domain sensor protein
MRRGLTRRIVVASGLPVILVGTAFVGLLLSIDSLRDTTQQARETRDQLTAADLLEISRRRPAVR